MSDVSGYLIVSAKASHCDFTCKSIPGFPPPFLFYVGARGEPGHKANIGGRGLVTINGLLTIDLHGLRKATRMRHGVACTY